VGWVFRDRRRYQAAQRLTRLARPLLGRPRLVRLLPGPLRGWTASRDLPPVPQESFRDWWRSR
jgi:L-lactate dehydrogenase complex protein LldF